MEVIVLIDRFNADCEREKVFVKIEILVHHGKLIVSIYLIQCVN